MHDIEGINDDHVLIAFCFGEELYAAQAKIDFNKDSFMELTKMMSMSSAHTIERLITEEALKDTANVYTGCGNMRSPMQDEFIITGIFLEKECREAYGHRTDIEVNVFLDEVNGRESNLVMIAKRESKIGKWYGK